MAGEYGVNINLRVKGQSGLDRLKAKVNELTASVDKIRGIDIMNPRNTGGAAGKKARDEIRKFRQDMDDLVKSVNNSKGAFGKTANQQKAAAEVLDEYANSIKIGTDAHKEALKAAIKQSSAIGRESDAIIKNTKARNDNNKSKSKGNKINDRSTSSALTSGLISGAFPLLFGQGLLGGAFGFAGGAIGTKVGGQMGGFAGGLVATAVLQQLTTFKDSVQELGTALNPASGNADRLIQALGFISSSRVKEIKLIEKTLGKQSALNAARQDLVNLIGAKDTLALQEAGKGLEEGQKRIKKLFIGLTADIVGLFNALTTGKQLQNILAGEGAVGLGAGNPLVQEFNALTKERRLMLGAQGLMRGEAQAGITGRITLTKKGKERQKQIDTRLKEITPLLAETGLDIRASDVVKKINQDFSDQITLRSNALETERKILELRAQGINPSIAKSIVLFEKLNNDTISGLEHQAKLMQERINGEEDSEKRDLLQKQLDKLKANIVAQKTLNSEKINTIQKDIELNRALQKQVELYDSIAKTIETGLVDAIEGAINGTKSLGDVARSVFTQIQRSLIQFGVNSFLGGLPGIGEIFKADGGPVKRGGSFIVGERGPELFTPAVSGMITPNHALGGSTSIVVNVDASGSSVEGDEQQGRELGRVISAAVQSELIQQKRPGGLLA